MMQNNENTETINEMQNLISRKDEAIKLVKILEMLYSNPDEKPNLEIKSKNIFLDSRWGDGKTVFIQFFLLPEIKKNKTLNFKNDWIIQIDVWDYDYLNNPIEMFFDILHKHKNFWSKIGIILKKIGLATLEEILKNAKTTTSILNIICDIFINSKKNSMKKKIEKKFLLWMICFLGYPKYFLIN